MVGKMIFTSVVVQLSCRPPKNNRLGGKEPSVRLLARISFEACSGGPSRLSSRSLQPGQLLHPGRIDRRRYSRPLRVPAPWADQQARWRRPLADRRRHHAHAINRARPVWGGGSGERHNPRRYRPLLPIQPRQLRATLDGGRRGDGLGGAGAAVRIGPLSAWVWSSG
jgi:hypothetical protein